jgi:oligopeptide transport system permease protein
LDEPPLQRYWRELKNVARGDLGYSFKLGDFTVNRVIAEGLPISAALGVLALTFAVVFGLVAGVTSAVHRGSIADITLMSIATIGIAVPSFVIACAAIMLFVFWIPIFPAAGWQSISQLILPALCLGAPFAVDIETSPVNRCCQDRKRAPPPSENLTTPGIFGV